MILPSLLLALHALGAVIWVGGMFFALIVLRPSLSVLEGPQRMALHSAVFSRFFRVVWHVMPIMLLTGFGMLFVLYANPGDAGTNVQAMSVTGLGMSVIFAYIALVPFRELRKALAGGDDRAAASAVARIRTLIIGNLVLGLVTVVLAVWV
jgi:uncharacterized membrane protein